MSSNASGERSFSILKRVKNYFHNSTTNTRLSNLVGFAVNAEMFYELNLDDIIDELICKEISNYSLIYNERNVINI